MMEIKRTRLTHMRTKVWHTVIQEYHATYHDDGTVTLRKNPAWNGARRRSAYRDDPHLADNFNIADDRIREVIK